tara:strand:- start:1495 stop:2382 length:888 start_codon:yes stop_codon:yes gene_type:complete
MSKNIKAVGLALIASFCAVLMSVFLKLGQQDSNVFTVGFMRFFFGFLIILPFILKSRFKIYNTSNLKLHITRSIINVPMMILGFAALMYIPLEQIKAIGFLSPILVVILSVIFLKERIYLIRTFSLILGFIGTLIILRPGIIEINIGVYMVLLSGLFWSTVIIITKFMSKEDSAMTILTYQYTFVSVFTLPLAFIYWSNPSIMSIFYSFLAAIVGTILHLCINNSYKLADLSIIQPVWFTQLIFASLFGFMIFGTLPDLFTWIGAILVFISVLIITYRENYLKKDIAKNSIPLKN